MESVFERLCAVIGYPAEDVRRDGEMRILVVDGSEIRIDESVNRLIFRYRLLNADEKELEEVMARLAEYAAGRLLKEDAVLAWDEVRQEVFLWQAVASDASSREMRQVFELFLTSCDWWKGRVKDEVARENSPAFCEMFIRP